MSSIFNNSSKSQLDTENDNNQEEPMIWSDDSDDGTMNSSQEFSNDQSKIKKHFKEIKKKSMAPIPGTFLLSKVVASAAGGSHKPKKIHKKEIINPNNPVHHSVSLMSPLPIKIDTSSSQSDIKFSNQSEFARIFNSLGENEHGGAPPTSPNIMMIKKSHNCVSGFLLQKKKKGIKKSWKVRFAVLKEEEGELHVFKNDQEVLPQRIIKLRTLDNENSISIYTDSASKIKKNTKKSANKKNFIQKFKFTITIDRKHLLDVNTNSPGLQSSFNASASLSHKKLEKKNSFSSLDTSLSSNSSSPNPTFSASSQNLFSKNETPTKKKANLKVFMFSTDSDETREQWVSKMKSLVRSKVEIDRQKTLFFEGLHNYAPFGEAKQKLFDFLEKQSKIQEKEVVLPSKKKENKENPVDFLLDVEFSIENSPQQTQTAPSPLTGNEASSNLNFNQNNAFSVFKSQDNLNNFMFDKIFPKISSFGAVLNQLISENENSSIFGSIFFKVFGGIMFYIFLPKNSQNSESIGEPVIRIKFLSKLPNFSSSSSSSTQFGSWKEKQNVIAFKSIEDITTQYLEHKIFVIYQDLLFKKIQEKLSHIQNKFIDEFGKPFIFQMSINDNFRNFSQQQDQTNLRSFDEQIVLFLQNILIQEEIRLAKFFDWCCKVFSKIKSNDISHLFQKYVLYIDKFDATNNAKAFTTLKKDVLNDSVFFNFDKNFNQDLATFIGNWCNSELGTTSDENVTQDSTEDDQSSISTESNPNNNNLLNLPKL